MWGQSCLRALGEPFWGGETGLKGEREEKGEEGVEGWRGVRGVKEDKEEKAGRGRLCWSLLPMFLVCFLSH